jgi:heat shock protein HtpX
MMRIALFLGTNLAVILVASLTLNLLGVGRYLDQNGGLDLQALLAFCAVFGFSGAFISLFLSKWIAKKTTGTVLITQPRNAEEAWLLEIVKQMSKEAGIGMPDVGIFPSSQPNAFATGWNKNAALVAVSRGLLDRFTRDEVRAVMGHEIGHVANGDMVTLALIQGVVNTFVMFFARIIGHVVDRAISRDNNGHGIGFYVATFVAEMVLGILASMVVAWFSLRREFRADIAGAQLAGSGAMIAALQRLQGEAQSESAMPDSLAAFGISGGFKKRFGSALATHPPLAVRIAALRGGR